MTFLQIVNKVLERLREDSVSSVSESEYSKLIGYFVNEAKEHMEDIWFWSVYETEISTSILGDDTTTTYDLTATNDRSFLVRKVRDSLPLAFDVTSGALGSQLFDTSWKAVRECQARNENGATDDDPKLFAIRPATDGRGYQLELAYAASEARTWKTNWYIPQDFLEVDGSDDNTNVLLPSTPIYLGALAAALNERGEEMGEPGNVAEARYRRAVSAAQEIDMQVNKISDEKDMTNLESLRNDLYLGSL